MFVFGEGLQRNLLDNNLQQGRSTEPFLLTNGIFQMSHFIGVGKFATTDFIGVFG